MPDPAIKLLYSNDREGDFVIGEGYDLRNILYYYYDKQTNFKTVSNRSSSLFDYELMTIKGDLRDHNVSFAMVSYPFDKRYQVDKKFCVQNSDKHLRGLIEWCLGRIVLRNLTEQESKQLLKFKEERKSEF